MKISDQAALLFISKAVSAALLFAVGPILVRYMDQAEYGTFLQINLITSFLVAIVPWGIPQAISFFVPRIGTAKRFSFVTRTLTTLFVLGCFGAALVWVGRDLLGQWEAAVSFGRIGARGRRMAPKLFGDEARMRSFIREGLRRRRSARRRIGVDYRVVDASEAGWDMLHSLRLA